jgi:hypothetical protein
MQCERSRFLHRDREMKRSMSMVLVEYESALMVPKFYVLSRFRIRGNHFPLLPTALDLPVWHFRA